MINIQQPGGSSAPATEAQLTQIRNDLGVNRPVRAFSRAEFDAEVVAERARIAATGAGRYLDGQRMGSIVGEDGTRVWFLATGGSNAANAAASHAKTVSVSGQSVVLSVDANTFKATVGAPAVAGVTSGDKAYDSVTGRLYNWTTVWDAGTPLLSVGMPFGPYANTAALQTAYPASATLAGRHAIVGSAAPYTIYTCNGSTWAVGALGPYAAAAALETAFPAASNAGRFGLVGSAAPYTTYASTGTAWVVAVAANGNGPFGPYASVGALDAAYPAAANPGRHGFVGSAAPYTVYTSNGITWLWGTLGPYTTPALLETAFPAAANSGRLAQVGTAIPYKMYSSNGAAWVLAVESQGISAATSTDPLQFQKWRLALNRMRAGGVNAKLLKITDSTGIGSGATGVGYVNNGRAKNRILGLASMLTEQGYAASNGQGTFGTGNNSTTALNLFDTRFVIDTASWASSTATYLNTLGRGTFLSTGAGNLAFTPRDKNATIVQCDSFAVYYARNTGLGTVNVDINGAGTVVLNAANATPAVGVLNITAALGNNTLNLSGAAGTVPILAIRAWNSAIPCIEVWQGGAGGAKIEDTVGKTSPWTAQNMMELTIQPDCTEISVAINNWVAGTAIPTYKASLQSMIDSALVTGSCYLITPPPSAITTTPLATQQLYVDAMIEVAAANSLACLDLWRRWVSYEVSNPLGYYRDVLHPLAAGYYDWASMDVAMLRRL